MDLSLQMQSPSPSQMPLVWPRVTQLAEQAQLPRVHRKPPLTRLVETSNTNTGLSLLPNIVLAAEIQNITVSSSVISHIAKHGGFVF